ncbi:MAG: hypothetical protein R6W68_02935 [Ignavibacteriaceae bacterium]
MRILFVFICALTGFFIGAFIGAATISQGGGLAGPAIVVGYSLIGGVIALLLSAFFLRKLDRKILMRLIIILALINLIPIGWMAYRFITETNQARPEEPVKRTPTEIRSSVMSVFSGINSKTFEAPVSGLGMAKPDFYNKSVLYFYSPNLEKSVLEHTPSDSIVFAQTEHHQFDITYAPPWFYPEHLKLDYDILYLKILTLGREWIEVEVNQQTGLTSWISSSDAEVILWPEFLLRVFSIENPDFQNNPLRIKPLTHASEVQLKKYEFMTPVLIKDNWIMVDLLDDGLNKLGDGWLMWRDNQNLLISYYLLL